MTKEDLEILLEIGVKCSNDIAAAKKNPKRKPEIVEKIARELSLSKEEVEEAFNQADTMRSLYNEKIK